MIFKDFDSIKVGDVGTLTKHITKDDVQKFVEITGDDNPLHVDRTYAESTHFKDVVVHGMLGASFISTVIGTKLPGTGALWVSQNLEFLLPVRLNDTLTITATVLKKHERDRLLELETRISNQNNQLVLNGNGKVKLLLTSERKEDSVKDKRIRSAIVTGGAGGIGRAICKRLAADGYNVVVNYLHQEDRAAEIVSEINSSSVDGTGRALAFQADIASEGGAKALYQASVKAFGDVNVLVNNASPRINPKPFSSTEWSDVQRQMDVQVRGAFNMTREVVPAMASRKWGRIVNITSQVLDGPPAVSWTGYAMAKGALQVFSKYMAAELGPLGINVNSVSPGMCDTTLIGDIPEKTQLIIARQTPLRRLAKPIDVAAAVAFFVSEDADFIAGDTIAVNGGMAIR